MRMCCAVYTYTLCMPTHYTARDYGGSAKLLLSSLSSPRITGETNRRPVNDGVLSSSELLQYYTLVCVRVGACVWACVNELLDTLYYRCGLNGAAVCPHYMYYIIIYYIACVCCVPLHGKCLLIEHKGHIEISNFFHPSLSLARSLSLVTYYYYYYYVPSVPRVRIVGFTRIITVLRARALVLYLRASHSRII